MIDWTKPVEGVDGTVARVERVLPNGDAILSWEDVNGTQAGVYPPNHPCLSNVLSKPREWWLVFEPGATTIVWSGPPGPETNAHNRTFVHVREVLEEK
jgi:hypothetical protein